MLYRYLLLSALVLAGCSAKNYQSTSTLSDYSGNEESAIASPKPEIVGESADEQPEVSEQSKEGADAKLTQPQEVLEQFPEVAPETEKIIPLVFNHKVNHYIKYFQTRGRKSFSLWLERSGKYIPPMKEILKEHGLPTDLVYMSMIESGFNVKARSHKAAVGPWQFIKPTAKRYGLRMNAWVDERMDPRRSTVAAANYMSDLYAMFQSWELAAASYNCGEDRVQNAIDKYQTNDFWQISELTLPRETRNYVPKFMAALIISKNPSKYGFAEVRYHEYEPYEVALVAPRKSLKDIAKIIGISPKALIGLNPALRHKATPPGSRYGINVPLGYKTIIAQNSQAISGLRNVSLLRAKGFGSSQHRVRRGDSLTKLSKRYKVSVPEIKMVNRLKDSTIRIGQSLKIPGRYGDAMKYRVRLGDTLGHVARRHGVSVKSIKKANGIRGSLIREGQILAIPTVSGIYYNYKKRPALTITKATKYEVRPGDTLGAISARLNVSVAALKAANGINGTFIKAGQTLNIPPTTMGRAKHAKTDAAEAETKAKKYTVKTGDTLGVIAQEHGVKLIALKSANDLTGSMIQIGQTLTIPNGVIDYRVRRGDSLWEIANQHSVSVDKIKRWNNLRSDNLFPGEKLIIYQ